MRKGYDDTQTITVLSNLGSSAGEYTLLLPNTGFEVGAVVTEIFTCSSLTVDDDGIVPIPMNSGEPRIVYPASKLSGSILCS